jgi:hypothetical protein
LFAVVVAWPPSGTDVVLGSTSGSCCRACDAPSRMLCRVGFSLVLSDVGVAEAVRCRRCLAVLGPPRAVAAKRVMSPHECFATWALAAALVVSLGGFLLPRLHLPSRSFALLQLALQVVLLGSRWRTLSLFSWCLLLCFGVLTTLSVVLYPALYSPCFRPPSYWKDT